MTERGGWGGGDVCIMVSGWTNLFHINKNLNIINIINQNHQNYIYQI